MRPVIRCLSGFPTGTNSPSTCPGETPEASSNRFPTRGFHHCSDVSSQDDTRGSPSVTMNVSQDAYDAGIIFF